MEEKKVTTKKVKKRRLNFKRVFVFALSLFLIGIILKETLKLNVNNIRVIGNEIVSDSEILKLSKIDENSYFFQISNKSICDKVLKNPLVHDCKIKRDMDLNIKISITENRPLFYYQYSSKLAVTDKHLIRKENKFGVPTLIDYVPDTILNKFIDRLSTVNSDIIHSISEIKYSPTSNSMGEYIDRERFTLMMNDGNVVYINNRHIDMLNMYDTIYSSVGDKKGYFSFDCDFGNYIFQEFNSEK